MGSLGIVADEVVVEHGLQLLVGLEPKAPAIDTEALDARRSTLFQLILICDIALPKAGGIGRHSLPFSLIPCGPIWRGGTSKTCFALAGQR